MNEEIERQRREVFSGEGKIDLLEPCTVMSGIIQLDKSAGAEFSNIFETLQESLTFFIPASGSGSRMFQFLHENDASIIDQLRINYNQLAISEKVKLEAGFDALLQFSNLPKGLIPFHAYGEEVRTAFQEHAIQAKEMLNNPKIHFTIQKEFEDQIKENLSQLKDQVDCTFSYQNPESNAFCFDANQELILENNKPLRRPAGHGALLENLNQINADILLIKNIDNIQHFNKSDAGMNSWRSAVGLLKSFQNDLSILLKNFTRREFKRFNDRYMLIPAEDIDTVKRSDVEQWTKRPTRVCGMVINEGEPGGGPFWVLKNGRATKQIVEKVQLSDKQDQQEILKQSTHFNPVFIALSKRDINGTPLDLNDFKDKSQYINVCKSQNGKSVYYRELPGLWNGGMSEWNTIFFEIPSAAFSPVKTLLDLAKPPHQP